MKAIKALTFVLSILIISAFSSLPATSLKINVIDNLGNIVEGATVNIYGSEDDYRNETNPVMEAATTNAKGVVKFKKIEAKKYYIYVVKGDMNNIGNGVETDQLEEGKVNKVTIVIE